jgi:phosphoglycolate phosphatase
MKQRVIMFDFDGVIADSFDVFYQALVRTLREFGYRCVRNPAEFRALLDINFCRALEISGVRLAEAAEVLAEVGRKVEGRMADMRLFPGVSEAILALAESGPLYVITSNQSSTVEAYLDRVGLRACFRDVLGADAHPSKVQKIRLVRRLHPRQSFVYVGDTVGDMREAHSARVRRAAALWGWHDAKRLQAECPDFLLSEPADLLQLRSPR